jgi:hypothetical protein
MQVGYQGVGEPGAEFRPFRIGGGCRVDQAEYAALAADEKNVVGRLAAPRRRLDQLDRAQIAALSAMVPAPVTL